MNEWVTRHLICDRPDHLRLSVSLGAGDGGFTAPRWCWVVYDRGQKEWPSLANGTAHTLEEAKSAAVAYADRVRRDGTTGGVRQLAVAASLEEGKSIRVAERLDERIVSILKEYRRSLPYDFIARLADAPENEVVAALARLADENRVDWRGGMTVTLKREDGSA